MKLNFKSLVLILCTATLVLFACQKDFSINNPNTESATPNITASVAGRITDENNAPVAGAIIKGGTATTTTDINGEFTLTNANLYDKAAYITVEKAGYFTGSRTFKARANQKHYVEIELLPKEVAGTFASGTGGTVSLSNGVAVTMPANAVVTQNGNAAYSGNVNVAIAFIDPAGQRLSRQMPGDLRGIDANNAEQLLKSYGMVGVELTGAGGEKLQIATGQKATVIFTVPASMQGSAPATIPLWHFNETTGIWNQEGTATKAGNTYIAQVGHFSFWNCDISLNPVFFSAVFKDGSGNAMPYYLVSIKNILTGSIAYCFTDSLGYVSGIIPGSVTLDIELRKNYECSNVLAKKIIGPFADGANINIGTIIANNSGANQIAFTGKAVDCNNENIHNGYIQVMDGMRNYRANITDGIFSFKINTCSGNSTVSYFVVNNTTNQQSNLVTQSFSNGTVNLGTVPVCGLSNIQYLTFSVDGNPIEQIITPDSIYADFIDIPPTGLGTIVANNNLLQNQEKSFTLNFTGPAAALPGTYIIGYMYLKLPGYHYFELGGQLNGSLLNITKFGRHGTYMEGNFLVTVNSYPGTHIVDCHFKIRCR